MRGEEEKKRRFACPALPAGWIREEVLRSGGLSAGKFDVYYYPPGGKKVEYWNWKLYLTVRCSCGASRSWCGCWGTQ